MINRYEQIKKLINEDIDESISTTLIEEEIEFENERHKEMYRDDMIADYLDFLRKDLQSDNA